MKFDVLDRWFGKVKFTAEIDCADDAPYSIKVGLAVRWAIKNSANLRSANLRSANLRSADLAGADLRSANLRSADLGGANLRSADLGSADLGGANLRSANLRSADLGGADLGGANLGGADLRSANLRSADLGGADLAGADLAGADLGGADLRSADLRSANLRSADLAGADLAGADLAGAKNAGLAIARTRILAEGDIVGWKKCRDNVIVKLRIPTGAKRSHAFGRKCRAEFADVLEVIGAERGVSIHDGKTEYVAGQRVTPDGFDEDWREECSTGVHFYISRVEAEAHS